MPKKNVLRRDNLSGIESNTFWTIYFLPGKFILWVRYIAAPKGKVFATARQAKSPIVTFLTATLFWLSFAYIGYDYFYYKDARAQVSLDSTSLIPVRESGVEYEISERIPSELPKVQLGAYSTYDGAIRAWRTFSENYSKVFLDREYQISQSIINEKTVFRLSAVGFSSEFSADQFCNELKGIKLDCFLVLSD